MSTDYALSKIANLKNIRAIFERNGIEVTKSPDGDLVAKDSDGNYVHINSYSTPKGQEKVWGLTRFGGNNPDFFLEVLDSAGIEWFDEYSDEFQQIMSR